MASTTYWSPDGKPISATEFMERLFGDLSGIITDEDKLRETWQDPDNREHFLSQLWDRGYDADRLEDVRRLVDAPNSDLYDVLSYILFTTPPKTREDRAEEARQAVPLATAGSDMKQLLMNILESYENHGEKELTNKKLTHFLTAKYGSVSEAKSKLGKIQDIKDAYLGVQAALYEN